jgi:hypothetical protein
VGVHVEQPIVHGHLETAVSPVYVKAPDAPANVEIELHA